MKSMKLPKYYSIVVRQIRSIFKHGLPAERHAIRILVATIWRAVSRRQKGLSVLLSPLPFWLEF